MSFSQKINLLLLAVLHQSGPVIGLGLAVFFCLEVLGFVLVSKETATQWIGSDVTVEPLIQWSGPDTRFGHWLTQSSLWESVADSPAAMTRTAALLAGFATVTFAVTIVGNEEHRTEYLNAVFRHIGRLTTARRLYAAELSAESGVARGDVAREGQPAPPWPPKAPP